MSITSVNDAKVLIASSRVADRTTGLKELINVFRYNRGRPSLDALTNKSYLALCDTLFQCMRDERSSFLRSKAKTARSSPLLPLTGEALRHIVNAGVRAFKIPTVELIIETIIEVLPGKDGALVKPLVEELPKALRALLEYQPHVERLPKHIWDATVQFCLENLSAFLADQNDAEPPDSWSTAASGRSRTRTPFDLTDQTQPKQTPRDTPAKKQIPEVLVSAFDEFVLCLQLLTKASNAPILGKAEDILTTLIHALPRRTGRTQQAALASLNSVLLCTSLHSVQLTKRTIQDLLPFLKSLWSDQRLRDEILVVLINSEQHLRSMLADENCDATASDLQALVETMYGEYARRQERNTLQSQFLEDDHLCFRHLGRPGTDTHPLQTYAFALETQPETQLAHVEGLWALVSAIARFSYKLDQKKHLNSLEREDDDSSLPKRPRTIQLFQDYLRLVSNPKSNAKRAALTVLAFMVQEGPLSEDDLQGILEKLTAYITDEHPAHASWAMLVLAAAAFQKGSQSPTLLPLWSSVFQSAARVMTSASSSRAACHLMNVLLNLKIISFSSISELVQSMLLSIELNGPALLTDSSSSFLTTVLHQKVTENPTDYKYTAERVLNWFLSKWTPSRWSERTYSSVNAHHCNARDILKLIYACLDRRFALVEAAPRFNLGSIALARIQSSQHQDLETYLLLLPDKADFLAISRGNSSLTASSASAHPSTHLEIRLTEFCITELEKSRQRWDEWSKKDRQGITPDMLRLITESCIVSAAISELSNVEHRHVQTLATTVDATAHWLSTCLLHPKTEMYKVNAVVEACMANLPDVRQLSDLSLLPFKQAGVGMLASHMSRAFSARVEVKSSFVDDEDLMDVEEDHISPHVGGAFDPESDVPRHDIHAANDAAALRANCSTYCHLVACIADAPDTQENYIPSEFVDFLTSLNETELLRSRTFISSLLSTRFRLHRAACIKLLERLSDGLIDPLAREYNTSEVANGLVVEVLTGMTKEWDPGSTDQEGRDLYDTVEALYSYYVKDMEKSGVRRSVSLQKAVADLLHRLLKYQPEFGKGNKMPSVRTSLFGLLAHGEIEVKYHIAKGIPDVFEFFILPEHEKILEDIDASLPSDVGWLEGITIRLLVLARLASVWHTLLRQGVYRIFAAAGSIEGAIQHAKHCISNVAAARGLDDARALFRLFAPQIIFTWLDRKRTLSEIPFHAFDYPSLDALLRDVEPEAVGQAAMLGLQNELNFLSGALGKPVSELLTRNFGKAAAYTISWDTCKGIARNKSDPSNEVFLREQLNSPHYPQHLQENFPRIVGYIFQTLDHEERITKPLEKRPAYSMSAKALAEMESISHSTQTFELGIEPSFSAFYLFDQLERLCRRIAGDPLRLWTPNTFTFVMRMLLDRLHPALGPLNARSVIRKIRILVALAGPVACQGYPLQMTLQSLRPFLTDIQCAVDTLGVMQYLLDHGVEYLRSQLSFVTGIGLSTLISIRVFLSSSQESTTQESQYTATMSQTQRFHTWLTKYLENYTGLLLGSEPGPSVKAFKRIITAASRIRTEGNSFKGTEESGLLREILDDVRLGRRLLNKPSREVALDLLCKEFQPAASARDDLFESDEDLADYAPQVWESCRRANVGEGYKLWAARVLGRAFISHGEVKKSTAQLLPWSTTASSRTSLGRTSREAIIEKLVNLIYSDDRGEAGLSECVIRLLISRLSVNAYGQEVTNAIPEPMVIALTLAVPPEPESDLRVTPQAVELTAFPTERKPVDDWIRDLAVSLCQLASQDPILTSLPKMLLGVQGMAATLFPYILHLVLLEEYDTGRKVKRTLSEAVSSWFSSCNITHAPFLRILIEAILYLRAQPVPKEATRVDRDQWLQIDFMKAAEAATVCGMYRSALLFAETASGQQVVKPMSRRSSTLLPPPQIPLELQMLIYRNLDEPDSFYGIDRGHSLGSVLDRLDHEADGMKSLLFRGARLDSQIRRSSTCQAADSRGMVKSLITLNMNSITRSLLSNEQFRDMGDEAVDGALHTARKLGQWDIKAPEGNNGEASTLYKAFQGVHYSTDVASAKTHLNSQLMSAMNSLCERGEATMGVKSQLRTLAVLAEAEELVNTPDPSLLLDVWDRMKSRERWMQAGEYEDVRLLLSCRETLFSIIGGNAALKESMRARVGTIRHMEVEALIQSSTVGRKHGALQESLSSVTYLADIAPQCKSIGLDIEAAAQHEVANVLWDQGESETSIRIRQHLIRHTKFDSQATDISLSVLLARLGHHIAEARLAKPDTIIADYLEPAITELKGQNHGTVPGQVFHEYALFCDKQLQNQEAAEEFARITTVMNRKKQEYNEFKKLAEVEKSKSMRDTYKRNSARAYTWYKLDKGEHDRLKRAREQFLQQCLENYLLSLYASDEFNNDALRVFSLWLEYADTPLANNAVKPYLSKVPSGKFALLMNQLSSRLQAEPTDFQTLLTELVYRICVDHPYHGMYQIFAIQMKVFMSKEDTVRSKDESAKSRQQAASTIASWLHKDKRAQTRWNSIAQAAGLYHALAMFKNDADNRQGREISLDKYPESKKMVERVPSLNIPPATLQIEVRPDCNYSALPIITGFKSRMGIANGLSAPKIITAYGSDGRSYKQLFKSGNDDLRQDAIMEQVFDQVSRLLKNHTATRLRNLGIRTYKVLPLSTRSGLMEFVQNTIPLHQWVMPAHERYYPSDWKPDKCRKEIQNCQGDIQSKRVQVWQRIGDNFHPVGRYFLLERFQDPDEWFEKRLNYTRSTAAISILGHVLGLGDRHCHNILLDEKSGEVVHIDLGVSFEAGRVLPVPEVVPFRLTRDLVDAMGYTKTEGVFRRCCEFTMDTLREERESIMTLLNVLRYDPLVNWSVTPAKAKRMQEAQDTNAHSTRAGTAGTGGTPMPTPVPEKLGAGAVVEEGQDSHKKREEQAGEAGRALSVVEKKLSKTLSTTATVNELIQTATDERNLAVLYCGWASYA
ncbi:hypothetical protein M011DRAFT_470010 [Sporormia fimetaria CBS 119925]|uniref:Serine/threonine-protein kinase Tel1 n=1 Tax=Sporormia fimetaria CBS 119925 TaxID=1340428 RepID=A0A6A6V5J5_9PLEO|nr:hypothetical protein M011DRAFT_470010 [Sporormia fimetaria CBS 119925]